MIDIVIPTLMQSDKEVFEYSLSEANASNKVNKIFIIDNTGSRQFHSTLDKVNTIYMDQNTYVNPAWNLGVNLSESENVVVMNDDIACCKENYEFVDETLSKDDCGLCSIDTLPIQNLDQYIDQLNLRLQITTNNKFGNEDNNKTGWFFAIKRKLWKNIPGSIKIIYGDDLIYTRIRKLGYKTLNITNSKIGHLESKTIKKVMPAIINQVNKDIYEFHNFKAFYLEDNHENN